jgi:hypothetical protein
MTQTQSFIELSDIFGAQDPMGALQSYVQRPFKVQLFLMNKEMTIMTSVKQKQPEFSQKLG